MILGEMSENMQNQPTTVQSVRANKTPLSRAHHASQAAHFKNDHNEGLYRDTSNEHNDNNGRMPTMSQTAMT